MKRFTLLCVLALALCAVAMANITPTLVGITGTGPFTWTYDLQLNNDQNANTGLAPTTNPVPHDNSGFSAFFTIYDFAGYITGTCSTPGGWTCTAQDVGYTPDDVGPTDNPNIINLTWSQTSGSDILGQPSGVDLGHFSAESSYGVITLVSYTSRGIKNIGATAGTIADNVGNTVGPGMTTPEPASFALIGGALLGLGLLRRKMFTRQ